MKSIITLHATSNAWLTKCVLTPHLGAFITHLQQGRYCYSDQKAKKEQAIRNRFHVRLEEALDRLNAGLDKKGTLKNVAKIHERIGRLREKNSRVAQDYCIEVIADDEKNNAIRIEWQRQLRSDQKDQHCGVYCLRTNIPDWSEEQLQLLIIKNL